MPLMCGPNASSGSCHACWSRLEMKGRLRSSMGGGGGADVGGSSKGRGGGAGGISVRADGAITSCNHRTPASGKEWPISRRCTAMRAVSRPSFCMERMTAQRPNHYRLLRARREVLLGGSIFGVCPECVWGGRECVGFVCGCKSTGATRSRRRQRGRARGAYCTAVHRGACKRCERNVRRQSLAKSYVYFLRVLVSGQLRAIQSAGLVSLQRTHVCLTSARPRRAGTPRRLPGERRRSPEGRACAPRRSTWRPFQSRAARQPC